MNLNGYVSILYIISHVKNIVWAMSLENLILLHANNTCADQSEHYVSMHDVRNVVFALS